MINQDYDEILEAQKHHKSPYLGGKRSAADDEISDPNPTETHNVGAEGRDKNLRVK